MSNSDSVNDLRVLVFAPIGRDSTLTHDLFARASIPCHVCGSLADVCEGIAEGAGAVLLTEEALSDSRIDDLAVSLAEQPAWSDISILLFAGSDRNQASLRALRKLEVLRNVTLLDRPLRTAAVVTTVQAALRGRQRQYELRDVLTALHRARVDAEHANRLKDEFLATVSHELRTPLNAILGWVSMLRQARFEPTRVGEILEIVERNAKAQAQLIADVLDISRMVTGRVKLQMEAVTLARLTLDAVDSVRPAAEAKGVDIRIDVDEAAVVNGDPERLQQVLWNLLSNAVKFTPPSGRIGVTLRGEGSSISLVIADTGAGIAPEFLPYVFDRFRQADQSFTRAYGGLGLGLAIVKHLVEMHGGDITASSEGAGRGATFQVRLPVARVAAPHIGSADGIRDSAHMPDLAHVDLSDRLILVVDDDETTRDLLVTMLSQCRARVQAVENARLAMAHLDIEVPSLLLADIGMPGEDGLSMMRRIRQRPEERGGAVPAVALSAYARREDREAALLAGFDDFLTKPAMPEDVVRTIDTWLSRSFKG
jgi:signal transduction histidine kinase/ActR/RegA family two-component response regulator